MLRYVERMFRAIEGDATKWGSEMAAHMPTLALLARTWSFAPVIECGTGGGFSTMSLLSGLSGTTRKLISYDIMDCRLNAMKQIGEFPWAVEKWDFRQKSSVEGAQEWEDKSVGLVFIDTGHTYELTQAELAAWHPKIHPDGIICGHDYYLDRMNHIVCGVKKAVDEFAAAHKAERRLQVLPHDEGLFILWPRLLERPV